jgi:hypothetical protein
VIPQRRTVELTVRTKADAEELLDWLEWNGRRECEASCRADGFVVRYEAAPAISPSP